MFGATLKLLKTVGRNLTIDVLKTTSSLRVG